VNAYIRPTHVRPYAGDTVQTDRGQGIIRSFKSSSSCRVFLIESGTVATADIVVMRPAGRLQQVRAAAWQAAYNLSGMATFEGREWAAWFRDAAESSKDARNATIFGGFLVSATAAFATVSIFSL
jgi:hypothetical protein